MPAEPKTQEMKPKLQETTNGLRLENVKKTRVMMMMENKKHSFAHTWRAPSKQDQTAHS